MRAVHAMGVLLFVTSNTANSEGYRVFDQPCLADLARECVRRRHGAAKECPLGQIPHQKDAFTHECRPTPDSTISACQSWAHTYYDIVPGKSCSREISTEVKLDELIKYLREDWFKAAEAIFSEARRADAEKAGRKE